MVEVKPGARTDRAMIRGVGVVLAAMAVLAGVLVSGASQAVAADADLVTWRIEGEIERYSSNLRPWLDEWITFPGRDGPGDSFVFEYTFDLSTPDSVEPPGVGRFEGAVTRVSLTVGELAGQGAMANYIQIVDGGPDERDEYEMAAGMDDPQDCSESSGVPLGNGVILVAAGAGMFPQFDDSWDSDQLTENPPDVDPRYRQVSFEVCHPDFPETDPGRPGGFGNLGELTAWERVLPASGDVPMQVGRTYVNHRWRTVALTESFDDPVVVAGPASWSGHQPVTVRVRNVTTTEFEVRLQEWDYLDGRHVREEVDYLVVERGHHVLPGGAHLEAGSIVIDATTRLEPVAFAAAFASAPAVVTSVASRNGSDAVVARVSDVSVDGFGVKLQEQEANWPWHVAESVNYVAWSPGMSGPDDPFDWNVSLVELDHRFTTVAFSAVFADAVCVLGDVNTLDGSDPANLRWRGKSAANFEVQIDEEQSKDKETWHTTETVALLAVECTN